MINNMDFKILERDENFKFYLENGQVIEFEKEFKYYVLVFKFRYSTADRYMNIKICKN